MFTQNTCALALFALLGCATITPTALLAQEETSDATDTSDISTPVLGFVFDSKTGYFRRLLGIPGAARLSESFSLAAVIHRAEIAREFALATIGDEQAPAVIRLQDDPPTFHVVDGALPAPFKIVLSPNGTAAALYYEREGKLQITSELSPSPSVIREISIHEPAAVTALAISDNAETVLVGRSNGGLGTVSLIASDGFESFLFSVAEPSAITFIGGSSDALISDAASGAVYILRQIEGNLESSVVGSASDGLAAPKALSVSNDGHWVFAVNDGGGTVIALDLTGGPSRTFVCPCEATGLHSLGQGSVFRISDSSPMWFLDANRAESALFFVPPAADSSATPEIQQNGDPI